MKTFLLMLLSLFASSALATNTTPATDPSTATATASATADSHPTANGGAATANGGDSDAKSGDSISSLTNQYRQVRSAPMAYAPQSFPAIGCGRGLSLGGSSPVGGAAVAFSWSNKDCEAFAAHISLAQSFAAIGRDELACSVLMHLPLAKEIWAALPTCTAPPPAADSRPAMPSNEDVASATAVAPAQPVVVNVLPATCPATALPPAPKAVAVQKPSGSKASIGANSCLKP